jgi:hypothetical protein
MDDKHNRISKLAERFKTHPGGRPRQADKERERRSFYIGVNLMKRLDEVYKDFNHKAYPRTVSKSVFLEAILEHGLENLEAIKTRISEQKTSD